MNFAELQTEVYNLTNRPDLINETKSAIKAATLKAHQSDFYSKDIYETGVEFTEAAYIQSFDYISLVSNFRALKYLRRVTDASDQEGKFFTILTPEEILDSYGVTKPDIVYVAGRALEIRSSVSFQYCLMGCYVNPLITEGNYSSWIAELYPYAIAYEAARVIFKSIGFDEQSASFERLVAEQYALLKINAVTDHGF